MSCRTCSLPIGTIAEIRPDWVSCWNCQGDVISQFPRSGEFLGINFASGKHLWKYVTPTSCPHCGEESQYVDFYCDNEGEVMELPLVLELPIAEVNRERTSKRLEFVAERLEQLNNEIKVQ